MSEFEVSVKIGRVSGLMQHLVKMEGFKTGTKAAFVHLKGKIAKYPRRESRPQVRYFMPHRRRAFFAKLKAGEIDFPYKRGLSPNSERLAQRWEISGEGLNLRLRNNASYASIVQGREQALYHRRTGWNTVDKVIVEQTPRMNRIIFAGIKQDLSKIR